eukprot:IDg18690t1
MRVSLHAASGEDAEPLRFLPSYHSAHAMPFTSAHNPFILCQKHIVRCLHTAVNFRLRALGFCSARERAALKRLSRSDPCLLQRCQPFHAAMCPLQAVFPPFPMYSVFLHSPKKHPPMHNNRTKYAILVRTLCPDIARSLCANNICTLYARIAHTVCTEIARTLCADTYRKVLAHAYPSHFS